MTRGAAVPAAGGPTVDAALRAAGMGPVLDAPVAAVLRSLGLPPLPAVPPLPPLPGLPPLPVLDLSALLKPLTDLLGAFGTGDLARAGDPGKIFTGLSSLLDLTMSGTTSALRAVDKVWAGTAATSAAGKMGRTAAETGAVSRQGSGMSIDIAAAGGIVAAGLAALQGVIAKTIGLVGAAVPFIWTPPGQAAALAAISSGLAEGTAVVAATKAQLVVPTARMVANGTPVLISGAPAAAASAFAVAATVLEAVAVPLKAATGVLGSTLAAVSPGKASTAATPATGRTGAQATSAGHRGNTADSGCCACAPAARPAAHLAPRTAAAARAAGASGAAGTGGRGGSVGGALAGPKDVTAQYAARTPVLGGTEPAALATVSGAAPSQTAGTIPGAGVAPVAGGGALGGMHAVGRVMSGPGIVPKSGEALADCDQAHVPAVFGAEGEWPGADPDDAGRSATAGARLAALREELLS